MNNFPKYYRNNPDDPKNTITVYNEAQESAVRESGYRFEVPRIPGPSSADEIAESPGASIGALLLMDGVVWTHSSGREITLPEGVSPAGMWACKTHDVYLIDPATLEPNHAVQPIQADAQPEACEADEAAPESVAEFPAETVDRYAGMDRVALRAEYETRVGEAAPGRISDDNLRAKLRELDQA